MMLFVILSLIRNQVSLDILERNARFIAESLAKHIYGLEAQHDLSVFNGSLNINKHFLQSWMNVLGASPRVTPFMAKKEPLLVGLESVSIPDKIYYILYIKNYMILISSDIVLLVIFQLSLIGITRIHNQCSKSNLSSRNGYGFL